MSPSKIASRIDRARGKPCPYCRNPMSGRSGNHGNAPTREHVNPRVRGGGPIVIACRKCNTDKGDLSLREWATILLMRNDFRGKIVSALARDLAMGTARVQTGVDFSDRNVDPIGFGPGIFA